MTRDHSIQVYLDLSSRMIKDKLMPGEVPALAQSLPALDAGWVLDLGRQIELMAPVNPRQAHGLALLMVQISSSQSTDFLTRSLAEWYLGFALNQLGYPREVEAAIQRARQGFEMLGRAGWIAACDWQLFSLSWTKPNLSVAEATLASALARLQGSDLTDFVPHCRLALAYAQILLMKFDDARQNIQLCEQYFSSIDDHLNQARCWLNKASSLRREGQLDESIVNLEKAQSVFSELGAHSDYAKAEMQLGLSQLIKAEDLSEAGRRLEKAGSLFDDLGMELWQATCLTNLGYVHLLTGFLEESHACFQQAGNNFSRHEVLGLMADNLNDQGKLNLLRGFPMQSIEQFKRAQEIHQRIGFQLPAAIEGGNLGEAYGFAGRYQDALHHLEQAAEKFKSLNNTVRLGAVEQSIALVWSYLNQPSRALEHLDNATRHLESANQKAMIASVYNYRAGILFSINNVPAAIDCLRTSLELSIQHGLKPQAARSHRLLGEALLYIEDQHDKSLQHLLKAQQAFQDMGMSLDLAENLVILGRYYLQQSEYTAARGAFEEALKLSEGVFHEVEWRAYAGLVNVEQDKLQILAHYRQGMKALAQIRDNFWQPSLAGTYLQTPAAFVENAIQYAIQSQEPELALQFMEGNKASTLVTQLLSRKMSTMDKESRELNKIKAEINWLQEKLRETSNSDNLIKNAVQSRTYRTQLIQKAKQYDGLFSVWERKGHSQSTPTMLRNFNHPVFRANANANLGRQWIALDYYLTKEQLNIIVLTPDECLSYSVFVSERFHSILETLSKNQQHSVPTEDELFFLGGLLVPSTLTDRLSPNTFLILSPHKKLHGVPWGALFPAFSTQALVQQCIPFVVPSLHSLSLLWERPSKAGDHGLLVGISDFQDIQVRLPFVTDEIEALRPHIGRAGKILQEQDATWERVLNAVHEQDISGNSRFAWMHIASHFSVDKITGRLSGLRLYDGEIWLDQLRDLSPLPGLVTFSACNTVYSFLHEGDEHVGLPSTCFLAGAGSVVGSLWPILDEASAKFMTTFHEYYSQGHSPAKSVAMTQRQLYVEGFPMEHWSGFICQGVP